LYSGKDCLEIAGAQNKYFWFTLAANGAKSVVYSDNSPHLYKHAEEVFLKQGFEADFKAIFGNLYCGVSSDFDFVVFQSPQKTYPGWSLNKEITETTMDMFLLESEEHLRDGGVIVLPYSHLDGEDNDPGVHAPRYGFSVVKHTQLVQGRMKEPFPVSIYELRLDTA
jgi:hypothetical protein